MNLRLIHFYRGTSKFSFSLADGQLGTVNDLAIMNIYVQIYVEHMF